MKFNELSDMMQKPEPKPDTYEAGMALNQLLKIGSHAIKIHNMIDDSQEMESWVAKKIDLASNYVKSVHGYTAGSKAGTYDDNGMTESREQIGDYAREIKSGRIVRIVDYTDDDEGIYTISYGDGKGEMDVTAKDLKFLDQTGGDQEEISKFDEDSPFGSGMDLVRMAVVRKFISAEEYMAYAKELKAAGEEVAQNYDDWPDGEGFGSSDGNFAIKDLMTTAGYEFDEQDRGGRFIVTKMPDKLEKMGIKNARMRDAVTTEDAGEGHMSKSQLYQTAKMSIELLDMIRKGDDLEGWVQTKLNLAADYLQAVYHYEDYQKLNPYREELDSSLMQRHAGIIQKHLDEILERKCRAEDVDTKPGMMRILAKRVNEVEKEIAKENRKKTNEGPLDGIGKAIGTAARGLGAKAAGAVGMKKTAAGLQGRVDVDKKSAELDNDLAQYIGQQRADKNRIDPKILQGFLQKQGIDQKYMQYVKGPINQQQASKLMDKISADSFAGNVAKKQPQDMSKSVAQRANQMKGVLGQQGGSAQQVAKGLGKAAQGQRMDPAQIKQLAPYAAQMQKIMADPKLAQVFKQLIMKANKNQTVTADVNETDLDEGKIKDWAKSLAMAGVIVAGLAGVGSIQDAIDRSVPAVQAMEKALEMAQDQGNDELAKMIKGDLSAVKVRLSSGKDLNFIKGMQDKYAKFIQTEGLTFEARLAVRLESKLR